MAKRKQRRASAKTAAPTTAKGSSGPAKSSSAPAKAKKSPAKKKATEKNPVKKKAKKKRRGATTSSSPDSSAPSPATLRRQLDRLDREIIDKINERARCVLDLTAGENSTIARETSSSRNLQSIERAVSASAGPLPETAVRAVVREVISGIKSLEKVVRVAFLGPAFSYSHLATIHRFGQSVDFLPLGTIGSVFEEVARGQADYGVVPVDNSTDGRIADTLENFTRCDVKICGEVNLQIHHNLLGRCARSEVREVYSRPQALSQCRRWLATHVPSARTIEVTSTATAAQLAHDKKGAAAVASVQAGTNYGLDVLAADIEDNPDNLTRFAVIGSTSGERTGNDKTSLMLQVAHHPGSLADALTVLKRNRINMTWIESFPVIGARGEYLFFIELEGHADDLRMRRALKSLAGKTTRLETLGSYARSEPVK